MSSAGDSFYDNLRPSSRPEDYGKINFCLLFRAKRRTHMGLDQGFPIRSGLEYFGIHKTLVWPHLYFYAQNFCLIIELSIIGQ